MLLVATIVVGFVGAGVAGITITVFLHRGLTHSAIRVSGPLYTAGRWFTWLSVFMRHWEWRRIHRKHHLYTDLWLDDVRHDPHSPLVIAEREGIDGFRRVSWHMAAIFHTEAQVSDIRDDTYEVDGDRPLDRLDRAVFSHPVIGAVVTGLLYSGIFALGVPPLAGAQRTLLLEALCVVGGVVALGIHIVLVLRFGGAINSDCHRGKEFIPVAGYATNVGILSVLIFGEGEHLTHHLHPQLARISGHWDLGWRVIQVLKLVGLTDVAVQRAQVLAS